MSEAIVLTSDMVTNLLPESVFRSRSLAPMDANDLTVAGFYRLDRPDSEDPSLRSNYPTDQCRAVIAVFQQGNFLMHLYATQATASTYLRVKWSTGGWSPWRQLA